MQIADGTSEFDWRHADVAQSETPVAKPSLPRADALLPYLRQIDQSRWYSNSGPLVEELERRLADHAGGGAVAMTTNATIGLVLALLAAEVPRGSLCMVPAWTFAATGHAIQLAGLEPWIVDVDLESWALNPVSARAWLRQAPDPVGAVIPVSPFGQQIDLAAWEVFRQETGIKVVIDAAAMFDSIRTASIPVVVSLHATKVLGVGEGAFVIASENAFCEEVKKRANFGFWGSREATVRSFNGKMSEYTAAVGLAGLDAWNRTRSDFLRVARRYRDLFAGRQDVALQEGFGREWISSTAMICFRNRGAREVAQKLFQERIGTRRWWGGGLHRHAAFAECPRRHLPNSEELAECVLGLPCWSDLPNEQIERIGQLVLSATE